MGNNNTKLKEYLDMFLDFVVRYSYKEKQQIETEMNAYKNGIISKKNFENLKKIRNENILLLNSLVTKLNNATLITSQNKNFEKNICCYINNIIQIG